MPDAPTLPDLDEAAYQRALAILVDVGTAFALELRVATPESPVIARAAAFERVALAVRRSIILSRDLAENGVRPASQEASRKIARKQVIRAVEDTIDRVVDAAEADALRLELIERVESPDFEMDLAYRSPDDLIREFSRDLGLVVGFNGQPTHPRRTPDDIAILNAQAAAPPGSGLARWSTQSLLKPASTRRQ